MSLMQAIFYLFSAILIGAGVRVITVRSPVHAALWLVLAFFTSAVIWMLLEAEFLAVALVLVYVGAVMVLFLFVVMMLDMNQAPMREGFAKHLPVAIVVAAVMLVELIVVIGAGRFGLDRFGPITLRDADFSNTRELGMVLYTDYVYAFEIAAVILLVAIIAAIALTLRKRPDTRYQDPAMQVAVRRSERVRLVPMASEPKE